MSNDQGECRRIIESKPTRNGLLAEIEIAFKFSGSIDDKIAIFVDQKYPSVAYDLAPYMQRLDRDQFDRMCAKLLESNEPHRRVFVWEMRARFAQWRHAHAHAHADAHANAHADAHANADADADPFAADLGELVQVSFCALFAVRCVRCALCAVRCALCAVRCALCAVRCAVRFRVGFGALTMAAVSFHAIN